MFVISNKLRKKTVTIYNKFPEAINFKTEQTQIKNKVFFK